MKSVIAACVFILVLVPLTGVCSAEEEKGHICFMVVDENKDGEMTFQEFEKYFGNNKERFSQIDLNKDGKLSHDEYHESLDRGTSDKESD